MTTTYNCTSEDQRALGLEHAQRAISEKKCVVFPTDTVYGIAADAFSPQAVTMLLASKGRGRTMPPPVLIPRINALDGLATDVSADARKLAEAFWPGGLTLILHAQPSLDWDLGETQGTVALRMPADEVAQELLTLTGPLAVSSANRTGQPPAQTAAEARAQLAESVEVYLEGGFRPVEGTDAVPSTIVDATGRSCAWCATAQCPWSNSGSTFRASWAWARFRWLSPRKNPKKSRRRPNRQLTIQQPKGQPQKSRPLKKLPTSRPRRFGRLTGEPGTPGHPRPGRGRHAAQG
ncbi:putative threonylcarbamoyl-AMP synthase [Arthrobacter sp. Hiyo4]|nr:putative threonylcarbamoyl-AMP synthase [Arthrobacter sp. Hiyo4]